MKKTQLIATLMMLSACGGNDSATADRRLEDSEIAPQRFRPRLIGAACFTDPCPTYQAIDERGVEHELASIDLSGLSVPQDVLGSIQRGIDAGQLVVRGRIVLGSWDPGEPGDVLFVSGLLSATTYQPLSNGVACLVDPCPSWTLQEMPLVEAASIDLSLLGLDSMSEATLLEEIADGRWMVEGWLVEGSWAPHQSGTVLHALNLRR